MSNKYFLYKNEDKLLIADTTDGIGFIRDLTRTNKYKVTDKNILIIGSGFVVDSILLDLIVLNPKKIDVLARNMPRIESLSNKFGLENYQETIMYDLVINTTPSVTSNNLFNQVKLLADNAICYDLSYQATPTIFHKTMQKLNPTINILNGLAYVN